MDKLYTRFVCELHLLRIPTRLPVGSYQVTLYDITSRELETAAYTAGHSYRLSVRGLPHGAYLLRVQAAAFTSSCACSSTKRG